ncbi:MAG: cysteine hydrolase [Chloroflexota bacterium]|nr:cysteine hydrolase [Chloroflexota bacterium]
MAFASILAFAACAPAATSASPAPSASSAAASSVPKIPDPVAVQLDPATTAVLVLDITNVICDPRPACVASVPKIAALLKKARDAKVALVAYSDTGGTSTVLSGVAPQPGDPKVSGRADKFFNTDLEKVLKDKGVKTVVVTGSAAHGAVLYTTFGANERGMTAVVAEDGISVGTGAEAFGMTVAEWQVLNEPGFANPTNKPLDPGHVTLSRTDLISFK